MILAAMIATDNDALVCDFAETYHILDYRSLPVRLAATLAAGLRDNSRIKLKLANVSYPTETLLLAMAVDRLSLLFWAKTKDAQKNRGKPESICKRLLGVEKAKESDVIAYDTGADFDRAWAELTNKGGGK